MWVLLLCLGVVPLFGCPTGGDGEVAERWDVPVASESEYVFAQRFLELNDRYGNHTGEDVAGDLGDPVFVCANGTVDRVDHNSIPALGNVVQIKHLMPNGEIVYSVYAHLDEIMPEIKAGARVFRGDQIGTIGDANGNYPPHLHLELRGEGSPWDPADYLGQGYIEYVYPNKVRHLHAPLLFIKMRQEQIKRKLGIGIREIKTDVMTGGSLLSFEHDGQLANVYQAVQNGWVGRPQVYNEEDGAWQDTVMFYPSEKYRVNVLKSEVTMRLFQPDWDDEKIARDMALADFVAFGLTETKRPPAGISIMEVFPDTLNVDASPGYQSIEVEVSIGGHDYGREVLYRSFDPAAPLQRTLFLDLDGSLITTGDFYLPDNY
jgi:hypothetical protein